MGSTTTVNRSEMKPDPKNGMQLTSLDIGDIHLIFTGERRNDHFCVILNGDAADLTNGTLNALLNLVLERAQPGSGFVHVSRITICRLRQAINVVLGTGAGEALIETGCREEYRLALTREQVMDQVQFTSCFFELEQMRVLSKDQAEAIRRCFPAAPRQQAEDHLSFVQEG